MARTARNTRGSLGNPKGLFNRKAECMLRKIEVAEKAAGQNMSATTAWLDRNEMGEFLVSALAAELNPDLGISVPSFPLTARQILVDMDGFVAVPDPVWKNRNVQYRVPHPGIVFMGVVNAKNETVKVADQIIQSGWSGDLGDEFEKARAKVRAGQILVDFLHFLEGKKDREFQLGSAYVAADLVTDLCFATAAEQGVTLRGIHIRPTAQLAYNELMENLGQVVVVSAFEGELEYRYDLSFCPPQSVIGVVRSMMMVADGRAPELDEKVQTRLARFADMYAALPDDEKRLVVYSAGDVLDDLQAMVDMEKARVVLAGGNGHADVVEPACPVGRPIAEEAAVEAENVKVTEATVETA